ncbi:MAG: class I SAM-dependent methyltransferase [Aureispira sp.]|nr:class I SAM-dependent methyltransferase [Aureispira sp.]
MHQHKNVLDCYKKTAKDYAKTFYKELEGKPLDRLLLERLVKENKDLGAFLDLGAGPGQTTTYIHQLGVQDIIGTDLSPMMVKAAKELNPLIKFEVADMLNLSYPNDIFRAITAFYAIVHFNYEEIAQAFSEIYRTLEVNGQFLFSFHAGTEQHHLTNFLEQEVDINFYYFDMDKILKLAQQQGFKILDVILRYPYPDIEYPSKRAYILLEK